MKIVARTRVCECRCVERSEFLIPVYASTYVPLLAVMVTCPFIYASATRLGQLLLLVIDDRTNRQ